MHDKRSCADLPAMPEIFCIMCVTGHGSVKSVSRDPRPSGVGYITYFCFVYIPNTAITLHPVLLHNENVVSMILGEFLEFGEFGVQLQKQNVCLLSCPDHVR